MSHKELDITAVRKTITLTEKLNDWVSAIVASGEFLDDGEYVRDLIRRDEEQHATLRALKDAVEDNLASGNSAQTLGDLWDDAERRARAEHG